MFAISPTDKNWFDNLKTSGFNSFVNFWTPTPWGIKRLKEGSKFYFMIKSPIRKIGGYGEFVFYEEMTTEQAWRKFGFKNGVKSKEEFINRLDVYRIKRSKSGFDNLIGCVVLKNCVFWDENDFKSINDYGVEFSNSIVKIKYFESYDPFFQDEISNFSMVNEPRSNKKYLASVRLGQSEFKGKLLKVYNNKCCISGESIPELLEAAHIQPYKSINSNHIQNGLILRVDLHRLYDNDLIYIDEKFIIHISSLLSTTDYQKYHLKNISLPDNICNYPAAEALRSRNSNFRN